MAYAIKSNDTVIQRPLIETNPNRQLREITLKLRKVKGQSGFWVRKLASMYSSPEKTVSHWALQVGPYVHELHTDRKKQKHIIHQRLTGDQVWYSNKGEFFLGSTNFTDAEINYQGELSRSLIGKRRRVMIAKLTGPTAKEVEDHMRSRNEGRYHLVENNCQDFVSNLEHLIMTSTYQPSEEPEDPFPKSHEEFERMMDEIMREACDVMERD